MAISVEELKELEICAAMTVHNRDEWLLSDEELGRNTRFILASDKYQSAIRELIAIKEAEPDAVVLKGMMGLETLVPNIDYAPKQGGKLIRKPE